MKLFYICHALGSEKFKVQQQLQFDNDSLTFDVVVFVIIWEKKSFK